MNKRNGFRRLLVAAAIALLASCPDPVGPDPVGPVVESEGWLSDLRFDVASLTPEFDPETLDYSLSVPYGTTSLSAIAESDFDDDTILFSVAQPMSLAVGANPLTITVRYGNNDAERVYTVIVTRNKLEFSTTLVEEYFEGVFPPTGWSVINNGGNAVWILASVNNPTGGAGKYADANSDLAGSGTTMDTDLRTPSFSFAGMSKPALTFQTYYRHLGTSRGYVDISTDGGATWTTLKEYSVTTTTPCYECFFLDSWAGQASVMIRFRYVSPGWNWFWRVDDVKIGEADLD